MTLKELQNKAKFYPLFKLGDVFKWFPRANRQITLNQLSRWIKKGDLHLIKKGVYKLPNFDIKDSFILANFLYFPSYISLETALNYYSIIPDIPFAVTSATIKKTTDFSVKRYGKFIYRHLKPDLFFGFESVKVGQYCYNIAFEEKAIFDFLYLNAKRVEIKGFPEEQRFYFSKDFKWSKFKKYGNLVSSKNKKFHQLKEILLQKYA